MVMHLSSGGTWECGRKWSISSDYISIQDRNQFDHLMEFVIKIEQVCKRCYNNYISKIPDRRELDEYGWNHRSEKEYYEVFDKNLSLEKEITEQNNLIAYFQGMLDLSDSDLEMAKTKVQNIIFNASEYAKK